MNYEFVKKVSSTHSVGITGIEKCQWSKTRGLGIITIEWFSTVFISCVVCAATLFTKCAHLSYIWLLTWYNYSHHAGAHIILVLIAHSCWYHTSAHNPLMLMSLTRSYHSCADITLVLMSHLCSNQTSAHIKLVLISHLVRYIHITHNMYHYWLLTDSDSFTWLPVIYSISKTSSKYQVCLMYVHCSAFSLFSGDVTSNLCFSTIIC